MTEICPVCGLPKELCICDKISTEQRKIYITEVRVKGSKFVTRISGIDNEDEAEQMARELKRELACGGTVKNGVIELQGRHTKKVKNFLLRKGYSENQIS